MLVFKVVNISARIKNPNLRLNEAMDYALVLRHLSSMECKYSLVLEDDAIISHDWFPRIESEIKTKLRGQQNWVYIKLFTGYKFFDWDWLWSISVLFKVLLFALFLYLIQYAIVQHLFKKRFGKIWHFFLFVNSAALVVFFNATCVNPVGFGLHEYTTGFGTVSVLVPKQHLIGIAEFLEQHVNGYLNRSKLEFQAKDLLLDKYRKINEGVELIFEPSLVQHIGIYSSVYMRDISDEGYKRMFKSFSFVSDFQPIQFDLKYVSSR